jgi:3-phenylpropionate/trans-cinnamate dioxygenase ferredoxin component
VERRVAAATDIPPGTAKPFSVDGNEILVCNVDGSFYAIEDTCTHDGGQLDQGTLEGMCVVCPRHGATFDVRTGAATLPAVMPVSTFRVHVADGAVLVDV